MYHDKKCQANELFDVKYVVWVPYYAIADPNDLQHYGVVGHYSKDELDKLIASDTIAKIPLSRMAELVSAGIGVRPQMTPKQIAHAYNAITTHLENWIAIGNKHGFWNLPPLNDLLAFDELAAHLYNLVDFVPPQYSSLTDIKSIHFGLFGDHSPRQKPAYVSYADYLVDKMTQGTFRTKKGRS